MKKQRWFDQIDAGLIWCVVVFGFLLLAAGPSYGSSNTIVVTIKTDSAESIIAHAERFGKFYRIASVPHTANEIRDRGMDCANFYINVLNMGGFIRMIGWAKRKEDIFRFICLSSAPPTRIFSEALCKYEGREVAAIRPEAREVDCKLPLPPGAQST